MKAKSAIENNVTLWADLGQPTTSLYHDYDKIRVNNPIADLNQTNRFSQFSREYSPQFPHAEARSTRREDREGKIGVSSLSVLQVRPDLLQQPFISSLRALRDDFLGQSNKLRSNV